MDAFNRDAAAISSASLYDLSFPAKLARFWARWWVIGVLWIGAAVSILGFALFLDFACDGRDYLSALHGSGTLAYSPFFLIPTLHIARLLPVWLVVAVFGFAYFSGWLIQLWVGMYCATDEEHKILRYAAPALAFFPGLLISDVIAAGNLAYILYGLILAGTAIGWRRQRWGWFYLAVLVAACAKFNLLTMLAIPLLCARREWMRAILAGLAGVALYTVQPFLWPREFYAYLGTLHTMSHSRRDFGCAPVGNLARLLRLAGRDYDLSCLIFYLLFAAAMFGLLLWLSQMYRKGLVRFESWAPVMMIGVFLLNPRVQSYDVAAITMPMAVLTLRRIRGTDGRMRRMTLWMVAAAWLMINVLQEVNEDVVTLLPDSWKYIEMFVLLGIFCGGVRMMLAEAEVTVTQSLRSFANHTYREPRGLGQLNPDEGQAYSVAD